MATVSTTSATSASTTSVSSAPFKAGDHVIGLPNNGYIDYNDKLIMEVVEISNDKYFDATTLARKQPDGTWKVLKAASRKTSRALKISAFEKVPEDLERVVFPVKVPKNPLIEKLEIDGYTINLREGDQIESNLNPTRTMVAEIDPVKKEEIKELVEAFKKAAADGDNFSLKGNIRAGKYPSLSALVMDKKAMAELLNKLLAYFKEFQFTPNFRFINTLAHKVADGGAKAGKKYISNYFKLTTSPFEKAVCDKMGSPEFATIIEKFATLKPSKVINDRLVIMYGEQGTGKTTKALAQTDGRCIVCNSGILPADLIQDFDFGDDGKPQFINSVLCKCMQEGKSITLDEINLLPFDTIRFLQGITDGKESFEWKGETIHIKPGFKIIGTMNLVVNGTAFGLPEPLVDRCGDIIELELTGEDLIGALD